MKISPSITIAEAAEILRTALEAKFGCEVENVSITSYGKVKASFEFDTASGRSRVLVTLQDVRHWAAIE